MKLLQYSDDLLQSLDDIHNILELLEHALTANEAPLLGNAEAGAMLIFWALKDDIVTLRKSIQPLPA